MNRGVVYALWDYEPQSDDELGFSEGDCMTVLRRDGDVETEWWWARCGDQEGYIPRNLLGVSAFTDVCSRERDGLDFLETSRFKDKETVEAARRAANRLEFVRSLSAITLAVSL